MLCPHCNTRHQLGAERCQHCGTPFTRRAARRAGHGVPGPREAYSQQKPPRYAAQTAAPAAQARRRPRPAPAQPQTYHRGAGPGSRAIGGLIALLIITIVIIAGAAVLGSGNTASNISEGISDQARSLVGLSDDSDAPSGDGGADDSAAPVSVPEAPEEPAGDRTWTITEDDLNQRIANRAGAFGPAEDVSVELGDGTVSVGFRAYGVNGTYHGSLTTQNGVPVVADSTIDGPIGWVVDSGQIDDVLNQEMSDAVSERQVSVESVQVRPGEMVLGISG